MSNVTPLMSFDSQEPFDETMKVVWWTRLDGRYQIEVHRSGENNGVLHIFDHFENDKHVFEKPVSLSYGAVFGPDVGDINDWKSMAVDFVDNHNRFV